MNKTRQLGFSLLEILFTIAIVGILLSIGYPSYTSHIVHVRRNEAILGLNDLAGHIEQFYEINNSYQNATLRALNFKEYTEDGFYKFSIDTAISSEYEISAIPQQSQEKSDNECGILSLNQNYEKKSSKSVRPEICWQ